MDQGHRLAAAVIVLGLALGAEGASPGTLACKPFDAAEVRKVVRAPLSKPRGSGGASMLSCAAEGGGVQVTLNHTPEPNPTLGSAGEFKQSVDGARAVGKVQVQELKQTRCASLLPSGGNKFGSFKAWCVLHSKQGRYVELEVVARSEKQLPKLDRLATLAEATAARIP